MIKQKFKLKEIIYFLLRILRKLGVLSLLNFNLKIKYDAIFLTVPLRGGIGLNHLKDDESWMRKVLKLVYIDPDSLFVDIGANTGQTLLKVKSLDPKAKYLGFEPNFACIHYLRELIACNSFKNTHVLPLGISQHTGVEIMDFYNINPTDESASIIKNFRPSMNVIDSYPIATFGPQIIKKLNLIKGISVIKIDVEGSEAAVIECFKEPILKTRPYIIIEILPVYSASNKMRYENQLELEQVIEAMGYIKYRIISDKDCVALQEIDMIGVHANIEHSNYLLVPDIQNETLKGRCLSFNHVKILKKAKSMV